MSWKNSYSSNLIHDTLNIVMQPILMLAIVAAAFAMSLGYLTNDVSLDNMVQSFGYGAATFEDPVQSVSITAKVSRTFGLITADFKDIITECIFRSPQLLESGSTLFCKLVDVNDSVIAEGKLVLTSDLSTNVPTVIPIQTFSPFSNNANTVHNIIFLVQGPPQ